MAFSYSPLKPSSQFLATGGESPDFERMLRAYIQAHIPALRASKRLELEKERLSLEREAQKEAERQGKIATGLSVMGTGAQLGLAAKEMGWLGGGTAANLAAPASTIGLQGGGTAAINLPSQAVAPNATSGLGAMGGIGLIGGIEGAHQLLKDKTDEWAEKYPGGEKEWRTGERMATRAGQGAALGSIVPGLGTVVGGAAGGLVGLVEGVSDCIIVTACTDPYSHEVNITRKYRDQFLDITTLRGYYMLAMKVVPFIKASDCFKGIVKRYLVDSLIDVGEYEIGEKITKPKFSSKIITKTFLGFCWLLGSSQPMFIRNNGEVI